MNIPTFSSVLEKYLKGRYIFMELIEILITGMFTVGLLITYTIISFIVVMLIQLISYRVLNFNIYQNLLRKFMEV